MSATYAKSRRIMGLGAPTAPAWRTLEKGVSLALDMLRKINRLFSISSPETSAHNRSCPLLASVARVCKFAFSCRRVTLRTVNQTDVYLTAKSLNQLSLRACCVLSMTFSIYVLTISVMVTYFVHKIFHSEVGLTTALLLLPFDVVL